MTQNWLRSLATPQWNTTYIPLRPLVLCWIATRLSSSSGRPRSHRACQGIEKAHVEWNYWETNVCTCIYIYVCVCVCKYMIHWTHTNLQLPLSLSLFLRPSTYNITYIRTVDGRNPAPVDRWFIPLLIGLQPSKVVQNFFHPQYHTHLSLSCCAQAHVTRMVRS